MTMRLRFAIGSMLCCLALNVPAEEPPFVLGGLHTDLTFEAAVAAVQKLGGECQPTRSRNDRAPAGVVCELVPCLGRVMAGVCEVWDDEAVVLSVAEQPIMRIGLEAAPGGEGLQRVVLGYEGSHALVQARLIDRFGPPSAGDVDGDSVNWSHSRRISWVRDGHRMGLLNSPKMIILVRDPAGGAEPP
ncbi:MAG: hypothetical protein AAGA91_06835 [Pseudomonadota bacterium]